MRAGHVIVPLRNHRTPFEFWQSSRFFFRRWQGRTDTPSLRRTVPTDSPTGRRLENRALLSCHVRWLSSQFCPGCWLLVVISLKYFQYIKGQRTKYTLTSLAVVPQALTLAWHFHHDCGSEIDDFEGLIHTLTRYTSSCSLLLIWLRRTSPTPWQRCCAAT